MNEKHLHEISYVDDNHYRLVLLCRQLRLNVVNPDHYVVEKQEYRDRYKVSLGDQQFYIPINDFNRFWLDIEKNPDVVKTELGDSIWAPKDVFFPVRVRPSPGDIQFTIDETDDFYSLMGIDYTNVEDRVRGLMTAVSQAIRDTARFVNEEMSKVNLNTDIVKDFDGIVTYRTETGRKFKLELCLDKIKPIDEGNGNIVIQRTPITQEDLETYFPNAGSKVIGQLDLVNNLVRTVFESKRIAENEDLTRYAEMLINGVLIPPFLDQNITYIAFGGRDDWSSMGKETPNNKACFVYLDQEVDRIFKLLESIPLQEGVEVWSIDLDTFAIFGRKDNKVVTPALQGYTEDILKNYSQGFERTLTNRMTLLDSPHIFKA